MVIKIRKLTLRNSHSQEKHKEILWLNGMWDPGWDTEGEQEYEVQSKENSINGGL